MAVTLRDIRTGSLAYFDHELLLAQPDIEHANLGLDRPGPFVCVQVKDGKSVWSPLTQDFRPERLAIDPKWRREGSTVWREQDQYLNDGRNTFAGPNEAFVRAGAKELPFRGYRRPYITAEGVQAILEEISNRNGALL